MNKFKFYFILLITTATLFSCDDDNNDYTPTPIRDYAEQYATDSLRIDAYISNYYISDITNAPGDATDQDVVITKIPEGGTQASIKSLLNASSFPKLKTKIVTKNNINYTLYYLVLREGTGEAPCNVDGVLSSYKGDFLYDSITTTEAASEVLAYPFEETVYPSTYFNLYQTITGWSEVFPEFKKGTYDFTSNTDGSISYKDFGAGVMFLPSGLAYYNNSAGIIPSYSPLIFSFKLYDVQRLDHDNDGIPSYLEDSEDSNGNRDRYMRIYSSTANVTDEVRYMDDTDHDGTPNFLDIDDDGDNYTTKLEIQYVHPDDIINKVVWYYPFYAPALTDDLSTPYVDESKGIPGYVNGTLNYIDPNRLRIHLDKDHH